MKGLVFTEFLGFVGKHFGEDIVDDIIDACELPSGGAYTSVGTYDHAEIISLCTALATRTGRPVGELVSAFGARLSDAFADGNPAYFARCAHYFDFLESIDAHIHKEVRKLYPDAELPSFQVHDRSETRLVLDYRSPRGMSALAEGLIVGSAAKFGKQVRVRQESLSDHDGKAVRFFIELA